MVPVVVAEGMHLDVCIQMCVCVCVRVHICVSKYICATIRVQYRAVSLHRLDQTFTDAFSRDTQLIKADPRRSKYLACGLLVRGDVEISDVNRNLAR